MTKIFQYFGLALAVLEAISGIQAAITSTPVNGTSIETAIQPVLDSITSLLSHVNLPAQLVTDVCNAAADAINAFYKK